MGEKSAADGADVSLRSCGLPGVLLPTAAAAVSATPAGIVMSTRCIDTADTAGAGAANPAADPAAAHCCVWGGPGGRAESSRE